MRLFTQLTFQSDFIYLMAKVYDNIISVDLLTSTQNKLDSIQS